MTVSIDIQANEIIETMSQGKIKYETKQALKKGFKNLHESIVHKLGGAVNANVPATPKTPAPLEITGWKKEIKGKKIFDWQTIKNTLVKKSNKKGVVKGLVPNKEMFEWWLLDVGSKSPSDFRKGDATENGTTQTLYAQILFFTGDLFVDTKHPSYNEKHVYEWFRDLQHLIQNNEMYWLLFAKFYVNDEISLNTVELNKPERNQVPLVSRIRAFYKLYAGSNETEGLSLQQHLDFLDQYDDDDEISVFRTFSVQTKKYDDDGKLVHKGRAVRKGITRLSDESGIHMEGRGYSYSTSKALAMRMGYPINIPIIKKHCKVDDKEAKKILAKWTNERQLEFIEMYGGFYRAIGHFTVKKKHIKLFTDTRHELEIIANPDDVVLKDYRFLTGLDLIATMAFVRVSENIFKTGISTITWLDSWYDAFHWQVKRTLDRDPTLLKVCIESTVNNEKTFDRLINGVSGSFYENIYGTARKDHKHGFEGILMADGNVFAVVHNHLINPRKDTTLYQKRVFDFVKLPDADKPKPQPAFLNLSGIAPAKPPVNAWFNKF